MIIKVNNSKVRATKKKLKYFEDKRKKKKFQVNDGRN